jgi:hypothetical protein
VKQAEEDVLGSDETMVEAAGFFLGQYQDTPGLVSEPLEHLRKLATACSLCPLRQPPGTVQREQGVPQRMTFGARHPGSASTSMTGWASLPRAAPNSHKTSVS